MSLEEILDQTTSNYKPKKKEYKSSLLYKLDYEYFILQGLKWLGIIGICKLAVWLIYKYVSIAVLLYYRADVDVGLHILFIMLSITGVVMLFPVVIVGIGALLKRMQYKNVL